MSKNYPDYSKLSPAGKQLALKKWHQRQDAPTPVGTAKERAYRAWLAQEAAPGLTNRDLVQSTKAATRLKYGETNQELRQAQQQNRLQAQRSQGWFSQYRQAIAQAGAQQAQNTQSAVAGVQGLQQGLDASAAKGWAGEQQAMSADAANRGATADPVLAAQAHNASNIRNALTGSYGAMLLSQGTNEKNALSDRGVTARQQGIEEQRKFADTGQKLSGQRVRLAREKGDFKVTYRQQAISDAFDKALKSALTQAQIGSTTATTAKTVADTTKTALENAYFQRYGKYPSKGLNALEQYRLTYAKNHGGKFPGTESSSGAGAKPPSALQRTSRTSDFEKAVLSGKQLVAKSTALTGLSAVPINKRGEYVAKVVNGLVLLYPSANIDVLRGAAQRLVLGHITPKTKKALKQYGVKF